MCLKTSIGYLPAGKNWILDILPDLVTCQVLNMPIAQVRSKVQGLKNETPMPLGNVADTTIRLYVWNS